MSIDSSMIPASPNNDGPSRHTHRSTRRQFLATAAASAKVAATVAATATGSALSWGGCTGAPSFGGGIVGPDRVLGHRLRDRDLPPPDASERHNVVVLGGGIAGLSAARSLAQRSIRDVVLLELENDTGGNSRSGINAVSAHPWGAHYLPLPGPQAPEVLQLLRELGVITGHDALGRPIYREEFLCHDPAERLFVHGRWQEGLVPQLGLDAGERDQVSAFLARMETYRRLLGSDGLPAFAIPVDRSSQDPSLLALDRITMAQWMDREGFRAAPLRRYVNYCCRDDFGTGIAQVSAWAGIHYFAARSGVAANAPSHSVLTWPEGNGWLAARLREQMAPAQIRTRHAVFGIRADDHGAEIDVFDAALGRSLRIECRALIVATPRFVYRRLRGLPPDSAAQYPPWMVANLTLHSRPDSQGMPLCWDNVIDGSPGLGYVHAGHQSLHPRPNGTVLTYYRPLDHAEPSMARAEALKADWSHWSDLTVADLSVAHPDLRRRIERLDVQVWGHGMIAPSPGFLWGHRLSTMTQCDGVVHFAHSDMSGISLFEEAYIRGLRAADAVFQQLQTTA